MKKYLLLVIFCSISLMTMADWSSYGCHFTGTRPSKSKTISGVHVWYNGTLREVRVLNGVHYWECSDEICVAFPKDYNGPKMVFVSTSGSVQIQYQK